MDDPRRRRRASDYRYRLFLLLFLIAFFLFGAFISEVVYPWFIFAGRGWP